MGLEEVGIGLRVLVGVGVGLEEVGIGLRVLVGVGMGLEEVGIGGRVLVGVGVGMGVGVSSLARPRSAQARMVWGGSRGRVAG